MKTNQLIQSLQTLIGTGKSIRYGDLMRRGFDAYSIKLAVAHINAKLDSDDEGYTIIVL